MIQQPVKIGSRASQLAVIQVQEIIDLLKAQNISINESRITFSTHGDIDKSISLTDPRVADDFFTDTLDKAILDGSIDIAIHSAKDLPKKIPNGIAIYALTAGLDASDCLVSDYTFETLPHGARIGTSSSIRQQYALKIRPDLKIVDVRGTIAERLALVKSKSIDALIVATCALIRLGLKDHIKQVLPWPSMPLQGQLAITGRENNYALRAIFNSIDIRQHYGHVTLVGAGPGDDQLITIKGIKALERADCVVYDFLVNPRLLEYAPKAEHIFAGKRKGCHSIKQDEINVLLRDKAFKGLNVVRLKGGDPLIFGRGADERAFLNAYHIPVKVVPGVSSATGLPSLLGLPLTARGISSSVAFISGHNEDESPSSEPSIEIPKADTLVFLMGLSKIDLIIKTLLDDHWSPTTPIMIIANGSNANQHVVKSTLQGIKQVIANDTSIAPPALIVVGGVVSLFEPTHPKVYLHCGTHPEVYANEGHIIPWPMIAIKPLAFNQEQIDNLLNQFYKADIVLFTSRYAVEHLMNLIGQQINLDDLRKKIIVVIGQHTADCLLKYGIHADLMSLKETAQDLFILMSKVLALSGKNILFPRSILPNPFLKQALQKAGARVEEIAVYDNVKPTKRDFPAVPIDGVIFTSPSTVKHFIEDYGKIPQHWEVITKGPVTAQALKDYTLN